MHRHALALAALSLALLAGACDDEPEPKIADPTSEPATTAPASEPPTSEAPTEPVRLSPVATVRAWIRGYNQALLEGDFSAIDTISLESCKTCSQFVDPMRQVFASGGRFETRPWRNAAIKSRGDQGAPNEVTTGVVIPAGLTYPTAEADPVSYETERSIIRFTVGRDADGRSGVAKMVFLS